MELIELAEFIVKTLVVDKDSVSVKEFESDEENTILIQVLVNSDDMGRLIGKGGKIANAVRTLIQASSYIKDNKRVRINIDSF